MFKIGLLAITLVLTSTGLSQARGAGNSNYNAYGYGSHSPSYDGYDLKSGSGYSNRSRYWGNVSVQRYNDPTGKRVVEVRDPTPPLPSGNYGRASNRSRLAY
jgi:hypothetical protein